jgi:hypothetical protein
MDPDADDAPLPFGGRQFLDALALGQNERAKLLLKGFGSDKRRARVLNHFRVAEFG